MCVLSDGGGRGPGAGIALAMFISAPVGDCLGPQVGPTRPRVEPTRPRDDPRSVDLPLCVACVESCLKTAKGGVMCLGGWVEDSANLDRQRLGWGCYLPQVAQWSSHPAQRFGICHWSNTSLDPAAYSGAVALKRAVKGVSEVNRVMNTMCEPVGRGVLKTRDASRCKGILLRKRTRKVQHLSTELLCVRGPGAIQRYSVEVKKVPRSESASDILAHPVEDSGMRGDVQRMEYHIGEECLGHP